MRIFLAVAKDRHTDDEYAAFLDKEKAIQWARDWTRPYVEDGSEVEETPSKSCVFVAHIGSEGTARVHVEEIEVQ